MVIMKMKILLFFLIYFLLSLFFMIMIYVIGNIRNFDF